MKRFRSMVSWVSALAIFLTCVYFLPMKAHAVNEDYYAYSIQSGEVTIINCSPSVSGDITVPATLEGYPVTKIGDWSFSYCSSLTSVTIPDSVKSIGAYAFAYCGNLTNVTTPGSVTDIGESAFYDCSRLTGVTISDGVTGIGESAFSYCTRLTEITIPDSVKSIGNSAFYYCSRLTDVTISDSVTAIGDSTFFFCSSLKEITIPDRVTGIGNSAFSFCGSLKEITIPDSVRTIGSWAFSDCGNLKEIALPDGITNIGDGAFSYCDSLTRITLPAKLTRIGNQMFSDCRSLKRVVIPAGVTAIGAEAFSFCNQLSDVYYTGTKAQWDSVALGGSNQYLSDAAIHYQHTHYETATVTTVDPTCTEPGYSVCTCACGESYVGDYREAEGHSFGAWMVIQEPNAKSDGVEARSCTCGERETRPVENNPFADVQESKYYYNAVMWAVYGDITSGKTPTEFQPDGPCTRGQVVSFLWRAAGKPNPETTENPFSDVDGGKYYYHAVLWAQENGIVFGYSDGTFRPDATCTRAQIVAFLYRFADNPPVEGLPQVECKDVAEGKYYYDAMVWANANNIVFGYADNTFRPDTVCTRAQIVAFLYRYLGE